MNYDTHCGTDECQNNYCEGKNPDSLKYVLHIFIYIKFKKMQTNVSDKKPISGSLGL